MSENTSVFMGWEGALFFLGTEDGYDAALAKAVEELTRTKYAQPIQFGEPIARIQNVQFTINRPQREYYEIGDAAPAEIRSGNWSFRGSLRRGLVNGALLRFLIGAATVGGDIVDESSTIVHGVAQRESPAFNIAMQWDNSGTEATDMWVMVVGAKLGGWNPAFPQDGFQMETANFTAKGFKVFESGWIAP